MGTSSCSIKGFQMRVNAFCKQFQGVPAQQALYETELFLRDCRLYFAVQKKDFADKQLEIQKALKLLQSGFEGTGRLAVEMIAGALK